MKFKSKGNVEFRYWVRVADVVAARSWIYRGDHYYDVWYRDMEGREWHDDELPLQVNLTRGQRIAFAWCATGNDKTGRLVAVQNCSTGVRNAVSDRIATSFGFRRYGRMLFLSLAIACTFLWYQGAFEALEDWSFNAVLASLLAVVAAATLLGYAYSHSHDPDPDRELDKRILLALQAVQIGWRSVSEASRRQSAHPSPRHRELS